MGKPTFAELVLDERTGGFVVSRMGYEILAEEAA
jgi:hypothetical protein